MGFNKTIIPNYNDIQYQYNLLGEERFVELWFNKLNKSDVKIGDKESLKFIENKIEEFNQKNS